METMGLETLEIYDLEISKLHENDKNFNYLECFKNFKRHLSNLDSVYSNTSQILHSIISFILDESICSCPVMIIKDLINFSVINNSYIDKICNLLSPSEVSESNKLYEDCLRMKGKCLICYLEIHLEKVSNTLIESLEKKLDIGLTTDINSENKEAVTESLINQLNHSEEKDFKNILLNLFEILIFIDIKYNILNSFLHKRFSSCVNLLNTSFNLNIENSINVPDDANVSFLEEEINILKTMPKYKQNSKLSSKTCNKIHSPVTKQNLIHINNANQNYNNVDIKKLISIQKQAQIKKGKDTIVKNKISNKQTNNAIKSKSNKSMANPVRKNENKSIKPVNTKVVVIKATNNAINAIEDKHIVASVINKTNQINQTINETISHTVNASMKSPQFQIYSLQSTKELNNPAEKQLETCSDLKERIQDSFNKFTSENSSDMQKRKSPESQAFLSQTPSTNISQTNNKKLSLHNTTQCSITQGKNKCESKFVDLVFPGNNMRQKKKLSKKNGLKKGELSEEDRNRIAKMLERSASVANQLENDAPLTSKTKVKGKSKALNRRKRIQILTGSLTDDDEDSNSELKKQMDICKISENNEHTFNLLPNIEDINKQSTSYNVSNIDDDWLKSLIA